MSSDENSNAPELKPIETHACSVCTQQFPLDELKDNGGDGYICSACEKKAEAEAEAGRIEALPRGYFKFSDSKKLKALFKAIYALCSDEATFKISQEGLSFRMMDPSRVSMMDIKIAPRDFEEFACTVPGCFAVDAKNIVERVFKNTYKDETVTFTLGYDKANMLLQSRLNRTFAISLNEPSTEEIPDPKVTHLVHAKLVADAVRDIFKDFRDGGHMEILAAEDGITFKEGGDDTEMPVTVPLMKGSESLLDIEVQADAFTRPVRAVYSNSYLQTLMNTICTNGTDRLTDIIALEYTADMPLKITPVIQGVSMSFWIAPRIQNDDD